MKKYVKIIIPVVVVLLVMWSAMLITDIAKSNNFEKPVFARIQAIETDDLINEYKGLGYTVKIEYYSDENGNIAPLSSEVKLFGMMVSAVIV